MAGGSLFEVGDDVEFWRVLVNLSILACCLVLLEGAVHRLEHKFPPSEKYQHMLKKTYRELMVLGLISFGLKMLKEVPSFDGYSKTILAFQVADLTIFLLALSLVLQSMAVFLLLHSQNNRAERAELMTTQDLVDSIKDPKDARPSFLGTLCCSLTAKQRANTRELIQLRLLRRLFLRRFGLPQLFPFSKYLNRAQANQIAHMIEVDASMWIVLLIVAWSICGLLALIQHYNSGVSESHDLVEAFMIFAWLLLLLQLIVFLHLRSCVHQLLQAAAFSTDKDTLATNLSTIAKEEAETWRNEEADTALETMGSIQEHHEELESQRRRPRSKGEASSSQRRVSLSGAMPESPALNIRYFSPKAWHVGVMLLLVLNGFLITLFIQCALYDMNDIYDDFGVFATIMVPLPLLINTFVLQRHIFYDYVVVSNILCVDSHTLSDVVENFREVVRLRSEFASSLLYHITQQEISIVDLETELQARDRAGTGFIEVDELRDVLFKFGYCLTRFRFNSVAKLLFDLKGTTVPYTHVLRLVLMAQNDTSIESATTEQQQQQQQVPRTHPMLRPSVLLYDDFGQSTSVRSEANYDMFNSTRHLPRMNHNPSGRGSSVISSGMGSLIKPQTGCPKERNGVNRLGKVPVAVAAPRSSTGGSARALHDMFNLEQFSSSHDQLRGMQL
uniref:EF-hand domain-containing protein n=1 Tax=Peronospora matthiolae TaxID=2874970 RepID=A0AAV1TF18_9STRA